MGKADADGEFKAAGKRKKAGGAASGKPKRGLTPFFAFLAEFRPQYFEKHPNAKGVAAVTKAAGEKWRAMSDEEKAQYGGKKPDGQESKPANKKKESTSSKKAKTDGEGDGSDKSKSDVEDDENDGSGEDE
uniref:HMG box domain-containing protein n=1 Tax=Leersia perrieri TaxID=77586 RepID=A0A0D9W897_9ORYZ